MAFQPRRRACVDGRPVYVFDGLLPDAALYAQGLDNAFFRRSEYARPETKEHRHWVAETALEVLARQPIGAVSMEAVATVLPGRRFRPYRAYTNYAAFGDMLFTHVDCAPGAGELTALWYLCDRWDLEWGGETLFFDAEGELAFGVLPQPGRLVVFDGSIVHCGRPPSRVCYGPRYTFAIKYEPVPAGG